MTPPSVPPVVGPPVVPPVILPSRETATNAYGADSGGSRVRASRADGLPLMDFFAYEPTFNGGVRVATGDVTGDGVEDVLTVAGPGGGPRVRAFDGVTGTPVRDFFALEVGLRMGFSISAADLNGDGRADIVVGAGPGGGPRVVAFDGVTGATLLDFFAFEPATRAGVVVSAESGRIAVGESGGGSRLRVFDAAGKAISDRTPFAGFTGGVQVAAVGTLVYAAPAQGSGNTLLATYALAADGAVSKESVAPNGLTDSAGFRLGVREDGFGTKVLVTGTDRLAQNLFGPDYLGEVWVG